jgi:hypothetical protein
MKAYLGVQYEAHDKEYFDEALDKEEYENVSRVNLTVRVLFSTTMWRQALLYAAHARREPTLLDQVGPLC